MGRRGRRAWEEEGGVRRKGRGGGGGRGGEAFRESPSPRRTPPFRTCPLLPGLEQGSLEPLTVSLVLGFPRLPSVCAAWAQGGGHGGLGQSAFLS